MKNTNNKIVLAALLSSTLLAGCGGGGGGNGDENGGGGRTYPFSSWANVQRHSTVALQAMSVVVPGSYAIVPPDGIQIIHLGTPGAVDDANSDVRLTIDPAGNLSALTMDAPQSGKTWSIGPGVSVGCGQGICAGEDDRSSGILIDPYALQWNYQTFGVWAISDSTGPAPILFKMGAASAGNLTTTVPTTGTATYQGGAIGFYIAPSGVFHGMSAQMASTVDFSARTVHFSTFDTSIVSSVTGLEAQQPGLNLSGTLGYAPGINRFDGPVTTANSQLSGIAAGRFYGPSANEIGGVFRLEGTGLEMLMGSFGGSQ